MALIPNAQQLIANAYDRLGQMGYDYLQDLEKGYHNSPKTQQKLSILVSSTKLFRTLLKFSNYDDNGDLTGINRITDQEFNNLLRILISTADVAPNPEAPKLFFRRSTTTSSTGPPGPPGNDGEDSFTYIGYADDAAGSNFSTSPSGRTFVAFRQSNIPLTVVAGIFAGLWNQYVGAPGAPGAPGADGTTYYLHIGWADDLAGGGYTATFNASKKFIAFLVNTSAGDPGVGAFAGLWAKYQGDNGTNGTNGKTIYSGAGVPPGGLGVDGDFYIDLASDPRLMYGPKTGGSWGVGYSLKGNTGDTGLPGADGVDGEDAFIYIAYADDAAGTGFTMAFDPNKDYIAVKSTNTLIASPADSDFAGLWAKYRGDGDRWTTNSADSLTIGTGTKVLNVETSLAYSTGQRVVISVPSDSANRMEGVCEGYDPLAGQLTVEVDTIFGSGTYASWDVSLQGAPVSIASVEGYYGTLSTNQGSGGTNQSIGTSYTKINQFDVVLSQSPGMTVSHANDDITPANRGAYVIDVELLVSGTNGADFLLQAFRNASGITDMESRVVLDGTGNVRKVTIHGVVESVDADDVFDIRVKSASGTNNFLVEHGRFSMYTVGSPNTEQFKNFGPASVGLTSVVCDSFSASLGNYAVWEVLVKKSTTQFRGVRVTAVWDGTNQPTYSQSTPDDIGTIDLTISVDFNAGNIRLNGISTTTGWTVAGKRTVVA